MSNFHNYKIANIDNNIIAKFSKEVHNVMFPEYLAKSYNNDDHSVYKNFVDLFEKKSETKPMCELMNASFQEYLKILPIFRNIFDFQGVGHKKTMVVLNCHKEEPKDGKEYRGIFNKITNKIRNHALDYTRIEHILSK